MEETDFDLLLLLYKAISNYKKILFFGLFGLLISTVICFAMHKTYTARALFMPPAGQESAQTTSLFLAKDPTDLYLGMLASRAVADHVIDSVHLMQTYHVGFRSDAAAILASQSKFSVEKNSLISIIVTTGDPKLSADIGNAYLEALYKLNGEMNSSASSHRREFFEVQLDEEKKRLSQAELNMKDTEEKTGTVLPEGEAAAGVSALARLQGEIQSAQARLSSLLTSSTEQNPQVVSLRAEIAEMDSQLRQQQMASRPSGSGIQSSAKMPGIMLDYLRASRDLKEQESLYLSLTQQYEKARIAALDPGPQLQIVDHASVPERKSGPQRKTIVLVGTLFGLGLGFLAVLFEDPAVVLVKRYRGLSNRLQPR